MKFTDSIRVNASEGTAEAAVFVDADADYLADHFPGAPMLPGLLMLEAAVRAAAAVWSARRPDVPAGAASLDHVDRLHIVRRVVPGDTLIVRAELVAAAAGDDGACFTARGYVGGEPAMRARFRLRLRDPSA